jgi:hypothetical protein
LTLSQLCMFAVPCNISYCLHYVPLPLPYVRYRYCCTTLRAGILLLLHYGTVTLL